MNPIEARHHLKFDEYFEYREGVVINRPVKKDEGSWADIGLKKVKWSIYKSIANQTIIYSRTPESQ